jgi:hypothetical protein
MYLSRCCTGCFRLGSKYRTLADMVKAIKAKLAE